VPRGGPRRADAFSWCGSRLIALRSYPGPVTGMHSGLAAADVMVRHPRVLPSSACINEVVTALDSKHVHMVLLTEGATLLGTIVRADLPADLSNGAYGDRPALALARLENRTVTPDTPAATVQQYLVERGFRRLAVIDADRALLGLMCLKQRHTGFCTDGDVAARAQDPQVLE
jgi:CBS domain-containing protein